MSQPDENKSRRTGVIVGTIAVLSLALNIVQFSVGRAEAAEQRYALRAYFILGNEDALSNLYKREVETDPAAHRGILETDLSKTIRDYLAGIQKAESPILRRHPVASFLVLENTGTRDLDGVKIGNLRRGETMVSAPTIHKNQQLLIPLDFRLPGNDFEDPDTPTLRVLYHGTELLVEKGPKVSWMGNMFIMRLMRER